MELMRFLQVSAGDGCSGAECIEVFNACRTLAYIRRSEAPRPSPWWYAPPCEACCCADFDDGDYTYPSDVDNPAPWFDVADPNSGEFFGFLPSSIQMTTPYSRVGATATALGRVQFTKRTITIEGDVVASSCCGTEYGKQWLMTVLTPGCGLSCTLLDGLVYVCCDDDDPGGGARRVHRIGLVSFEDISEADYDCCEGAKVRIVLEAETSWLYGEPITIVADQPLITEAPECGCPTWVRCVPGDDPCVLPEDCLPAVPPPPQVTQGGCYCEPLSQSSVCLGTPLLPDWRDYVLRFEVASGAAPLRNARIDIWRNTTNGPCDAPEEGRQPIATLLVGYVPASSTVVVDGETGEQLMCCPGGAQAADAFVAGGDGGPFVDPVITCGGETLCICATVDCLNTDLGATLTIDVVPRWAA